ncbi:cytochrome b [Pseudomonas tohonis]|uniref:cytochrome b n=1 Tax=Pseudomonas tohonis TaxID=2725477 RepID=UPI0021DB4CE3|nr:cytochrome b/b6 domain-containing protein [Pseudomonas tohonis]UXY50723.1 cytochrome b/b6 domain-containing protein [Pseudomonas tohonis]
MSSLRYSRPRILLHWGFAFIILWATVSGFTNALVELPSPLPDVIGFINVSLTALLIPFFVLRIGYALAQPGPAHAHRGNALGSFLAKAGHLALYIATALVLATGVLMMDRPIDLFGLASLPQPLNEPSLIEFFNRCHRVFCIALALLVAGHIGAVALHHLTGQPVLARMKP